MNKSILKRCPKCGKTSGCTCNLIKPLKAAERVRDTLKDHRKMRGSPGGKAGRPF